MTRNWIFSRFFTAASNPVWKSLEDGECVGVNFARMGAAVADQRLAGPGRATTRPTRLAVPLSVGALQEPLDAVLALDNAPARTKPCYDGAVISVAFPGGCFLQGEHKSERTSPLRCTWMERPSCQPPADLRQITDKTRQTAAQADSEVAT